MAGPSQPNTNPQQPTPQTAQGLGGPSAMGAPSTPGFSNQPPPVAAPSGDNPVGVLPMWEAWMKQGPAEYFPGNTVAGFTPAQQASWLAQFQGSQQVADAGQGMMNEFQQGFSPTMDWFNNPYLDQSIEGALKDATTAFNRDVMPGINTSFASQPGSTRQGIAQGLAAGDLSRNLGNIAMNARMGAYESGKQSYLQDMSNQNQRFGMMPGMLNAYGQSAMAPGSVLGNIGQQQQAMNQAQIDAMRDRWDFYQNRAGNKLGQGISMLTGMGLGGYGKTQSSSGGGKK